MSRPTSSALFVERVADYRAVVVRCAPSGVADAVRAGLGGATRVVVPAGLPDASEPVSTAASSSTTTRR